MPVFLEELGALLRGAYHAPSPSVQTLHELDLAVKEVRPNALTCEMAFDIVWWNEKQDRAVVAPRHELGTTSRLGRRQQVGLDLATV